MNNLNHSRSGGSACSARLPSPDGTLINTGALARWKDAHSTWELFQQFANRCRKPLKRLLPPRTALHRAKAPVLIRTCVDACGRCGLFAAALLLFTRSSGKRFAAL